MAVNITPTAGVKIQVSAAAPATFNETGYNALTWTDVGGVDDGGEIGDAYEMQSFDSLTDGRIPYRGILDGGTISASLADDPADAGQVLMKAAFDAAKGAAAEKLSYRVIDESSNYTAAQVLVGSWRRQFGGANDLIRRMAEMRVIPGTVAEGTQV